MNAATTFMSRAAIQVMAEEIHVGVRHGELRFERLVPGLVGRFEEMVDSMVPSADQESTAQTAARVSVLSSQSFAAKMTTAAL